MHHWIGHVSIGKIVEYRNNNIHRSRSQYFQSIHQEMVSKYAPSTTHGVPLTFGSILVDTAWHYLYLHPNCIQKTHWFDDDMYIDTAQVSTSIDPNVNGTP